MFIISTYWSLAGKSLGTVCVGLCGKRFSVISVPTKPQKLDVSTTLPVANLSHAWPSTLPVTGDLSGGSSALGGIPPAVAFAPYYFRDLPSAQRKNLYFASPPPPLEQQQLRSTTDRARDAALDRRVRFCSYGLDSSGRKKQWCRYVSHL